MNVSITAIPSNFDTVVDTISYGIFVFNKNNRPQVNCRNNNGTYGFLVYVDKIYHICYNKNSCCTTTGAERGEPTEILIYKSGELHCYF